MQRSAVVVVGMGQLGSLFAEGWLRRGHPVFPVTKEMSPAEVSLAVPEPEMVLVAVAEDALAEALASIPPRWGGRLALVQNELVPPDWERRGLPEPSVAVVWFERKGGQPPKVVAPTLLLGPGASLLAEALEPFDLPVRTLVGRDSLLRELVRKNLFIFTTNLAGLRLGGTTGELATTHWEWVQQVAVEVLAVQNALCCVSVSQQQALATLREDLLRVPSHGCMGRSAPQRLNRLLAAAERQGVALKVLSSLLPVAGSA
jgi:ketopantoate reductase